MYIPYLLARVSARYRPNASGMSELLGYDYMGSAEFEFGAIPDANSRTRTAIANGESFSLVALRATPSKPAMEGRRFVQGQTMYALLRTSLLASYGASLNGEMQKVFDGKRQLKEFFGADQNFALWHDIKNDVYFSPNPTFLNLIYSVMSRPPEFSTTIDKELRVGDVIKIAVVLNGRSMKSVNDMHVKQGRVSAILDDTVIVKDRKPYRMPFVYILTHELEITEAP